MTSKRKPEGGETGTRRIRTGVLLAVVGACIAAASAISWHSVEEIHYLKTFYPARFTVQEALYASMVEWIKVGLAVFPLLLTVAAALILLRRYDREP